MSPKQQGNCQLTMGSESSCNVPLMFTCLWGRVAWVTKLDLGCSWCISYGILCAWAAVVIADGVTTASTCAATTLVWSSTGEQLLFKMMKQDLLESKHISVCVKLLTSWPYVHTGLTLICLVPLAADILTRGYVTPSVGITETATKPEEEEEEEDLERWGSHTHTHTHIHTHKWDKEDKDLTVFFFFLKRKDETQRGLPRRRSITHEGSVAIQHAFMNASCICNHSFSTAGPWIFFFFLVSVCTKEVIYQTNTCWCCNQGLIVRLASSTKHT